MKVKNKLIIWSIEIKRQAENVMFWFLKKAYGRRERHCSNGFYAISKFFEMKVVVISVKVEIQYLEKCASHRLAKQPYKRFVEISFKWVDPFSKCSEFVIVAANHRPVIRKRNLWKIPEHTFTYICLYLHVTLFIMHGEIKLQRENLIL